MNTVTHALIPAIAAGICVRAFRPPEQGSRCLGGKDIVLIGLFGAAPDLLNPHTSLEARYASWSPTGYFEWYRCYWLTVKNGSPNHNLRLSGGMPLWLEIFSDGVTVRRYGCRITEL